MAEHGTRKTTIVHHESFADQHFDLASKVALLLDRFNHEPPVPPPQPVPTLSHPHIKLEEEHITLVSFYLDGPALSWFQWSY